MNERSVLDGGIDGPYNEPDYSELLKEVQQLRLFAGFVESVVCNPVGSYSVAALDGIFSRLRGRIAALPK